MASMTENKFIAGQHKRLEIERKKREFRDEIYASGCFIIPQPAEVKRCDFIRRPDMVILPDGKQVII